MHGFMPKRSQAYLWRPAHPSTTIGEPARAPTNNAACGSCSKRPALRRGRVELFNALAVAHRTLNGEWERPCCTPR